MSAGILKTFLSAAPLLLALIFVSPALAYKAGQGADDTPADIPEYADAAAYLADPNRGNFKAVKIGQHILSTVVIAQFHASTGLTNSNLIASYADVAAYLADTGRANRLYAEIDGNVYLVAALETSNNAGTLSDASLPYRATPSFATVAVGDGAKATAYDATAVGWSADATGARSTAVGYSAAATGNRATALGYNSGAHGFHSTALGGYSHASGNRTTAVGRAANSYGTYATSLGADSAALGRWTTALGRGAHAVNLDADQYLWDAFSDAESWGVGGLIDCAHDPTYSVQGFVANCDQYLTADEKADARLAQDDAAGETFRQGIRTRLQGRLTALSTSSATAVGTHARAFNTGATAVGHYAQATGEWSTALGRTSDAAGERSTALGGLAWATGRYASAVGHYAEAHGENTVALGRKAVAGGVAAGRIYTNVREYLADSDRTTRGDNVVIGGKVYAVTALEAVSGLSRTNLPDPVAAMPGGIAVGADSRAAGQDSIAFGRGASATGENAIAIGAGVAASANQIVVGGSGHTYRLPGVAATQAANPEVLTVNRDGQLSADGGNLHGLVGAPTDTANRDGNAYARIRSIQETLDTASEEESAAIGRANVIQTVSDATRSLDADADGDGEVDATGDGRRVREIVDEVDRGVEDRVAVARIRTGSGAERTVVTLKGATNEQVMALVALLTDTRLSTEPAVDANGDPVGTTMTEFLTLDENKGQPLKASERLAYLFQALYGTPYGATGVADAATDSDRPHAASIAGRLASIDGFIPRGTDGALEKAPVTEAEETPGGVERKIVVQDAYQEGDTRRVRLRTLDFSQLAGADHRLNALDRRVGELDARLDKTTAMASALTALPNVVPHSGRFFLGVGAGQYGGESALAIGMSARVGEMNNVFVNAGVAAASGASAAGRAGVGFVW